MSDDARKELPPAPEPPSKTDGSGTPTVDLERTIGLFAGRLRRKHAEEIRTDARKFKSRVITILRRKLPPFAGRPTEAAITSAIELRKHDQPWKEIYPHCIRNHSELDPAARRQAESNLASGLSATLPLL